MAHAVKPGGDPDPAAEPGGSDLARHLHTFANELDYVYRTLRRYGVQAVDAEDVAQEVFLIAWRRRGDFDTSRPLRPWLGGIAYKLAHQYHQRRKPTLIEDVGEGFADVEPTAPPELEPEALDARALVLRVLARLPERHREVLVAHELDGASVEDIATRWRVPRFTLYTRLRRARQAFAEEVDRIQSTTGGRPALARSLAPGLLLTMEREVPPAPAALHRHVMERLRAEALLAGRATPGGNIGWLFRTGLGPLGLAAAICLTAALVAVGVSRRTSPRAPDPQPSPTAAARPSTPRPLPPPRLVPAPAMAGLPPAAPATASGLGRDLVGHWRFEDGTGSHLAVEQSARHRPCELRQLDPARAWIPGVAGGAIDLGLNGWLECPLPALPRRATAEMTVAVWVKRAGSPAMHRALVTRAMDEGRRNYFFFGFNGDQLTLSSSGWGGALSTPFREAPGRWVHVAFTHGSDHDVKLYIAGREVARKRSTPRVFGSTQQPLLVGGGLRPNAPDDQVRQLFEGAVDELRVYERALAEVEIRELATTSATSSRSPP
jgi:RNA polymerase sigma-70 factor (ECF subfamily)